MAQTYPPLQILQKSDCPGREFEEVINKFKSIPGVERMQKKEMIQFFLQKNFLCTHMPELSIKRSPVWVKMEQALQLNAYSLLLQAGFTDEVIRDRHFNIASEIRDIFLGPILWQEWGRAKQVYKPDTDFADALLNTKKLQMTRSMLKHLPCHTFYIDVSSCRQFGNICGILVHIQITEEDCKFAMYLLSPNLVYFSFYIGGRFDENGVVGLNLDELAKEDPEYGYEIWHPRTISELQMQDIKASDYTLSRNSIHIFAMQMISYLTIDEPQLTESPLTKGTYRPRPAGSPVRNKWSEVKIEDVGIRYGTTFRKQVKEIAKIQNKQDGEKRHRKSPIPHFRAAHWQRYWVGEGRKECRVNWLEPVFVGNNVGSDIIIHNIKNT